MEKQTFSCSVAMAEGLAGQQAVITGAARGIGRAVAARFVSAGADVLALDVDADAGAAAAAELGCRFHALDVTREADWEALKHGRVDVLVNNAGGLLSAALLHEHDVDTWRATLELNLTSVFLAMRWALARMLGQGAGAIVNVCSVSGIVGQMDAPAYQAAKAGVAMLTRNAAIAYGPRGIRINAVSPSIVDTWALDDEQSERRAAFLSRVPLGHVAQPEDIAGAIAYLASNDARYVSGANLAVDGGYLA